MQNLRATLRILLGLIYLIFGLNFFFQFLPMPQPPEGPLTAFSGALFQTGYFLQFVKITEVVVGALLVLNLFVPLALIVIAPVTLNIFLVHFFLDRTGLPVAFVLLILNVTLGFLYFGSYKSVLKMRN